jgi:hypothetical protein
MPETNDCNKRTDSISLSLIWRLAIEEDWTCNPMVLTNANPDKVLMNLQNFISLISFRNMADYLVNYRQNPSEEIFSLIEGIKAGVIPCLWYTPGGYSPKGKAPLYGGQMYKKGDNLNSSK